jgi:hypothetical protein
MDANALPPCKHVIAGYWICRNEISKGAKRDLNEPKGVAAVHAGFSAQRPKKVIHNASTAHPFHA